MAWLRRRKAGQTGGSANTDRHALAAELDALGLWRGLSDDIRKVNSAEVADGLHPWATTIADDVMFFADGEDLAEGAVERFLADLSKPLQARGVVLDVETISGPSTGSYVISINGNRIELYGEGSWDSIDEAEHPWYASTVRPLAFVNRLLATSGVVERLFTLYTGGNEGIVLLIDPAIVSCLLSAGLRDSAETPVEASS